MKILLSIIKKDVVFAKYSLMAYWALITLFIFYQPSLLEFRWAQPEIIAFAIAIIGTTTVASVIHNDPLVGDVSFLGTRPVPRALILAEKVAFTALFLIAPGCLAAALSPFPGSCMSLLAFSALIIMLAVLTRENSETLLALVVAFLLLHYSPRSAPNPPYSRGVLETAGYLYSVLAIFGYLIIAFDWAIYRRWKRVAWQLSLFLLLHVGIHRLWRWDLVSPGKLFGKKVPSAEIVWTKPIQSSMSGSTINSVTIHRIALSGSFEVKGADRSWTPFIIEAEGIATFPIGRPISSHVSTNRPIEKPFQFWDIEAFLNKSGFMNMNKFRANLPNFSGRNEVFFEAPEDQIARRANSVAHIQGYATIQLVRPVILGEMPFKQGESVEIKGYPYQLTSIQPKLNDDKKMEFTVRYLSSLAGHFLGSREYHFILKNQETKQFVIITELSGDQVTRGRGTVVFSIDTTKLSDAPFNFEEFIRNAKLVIIGSETGPLVRAPFDFPEVPFDSPELDLLKRSLKR